MYIYSRKFIIHLLLTARYHSHRFSLCRGYLKSQLAFKELHKIFLFWRQGLGTGTGSSISTHKHSHSLSLTNKHTTYTHTHSHQLCWPRTYQQQQQPVLEPKKQQQQRCIANTLEEIEELAPGSQCCFPVAQPTSYGYSDPDPQPPTCQEHGSGVVSNSTYKYIHTYKHVYIYTYRNVCICVRHIWENLKIGRQKKRQQNNFECACVWARQGLWNRWARRGSASDSARGKKNPANQAHIMLRNAPKWRYRSSRERRPRNPLLQMDSGQRSAKQRSPFSLRSKPLSKEQVTKVCLCAHVNVFLCLCLCLCVYVLLFLLRVLRCWSRCSLSLCRGLASRFSPLLCVHCGCKASISAMSHTLSTNLARRLLNRICESF